MKKEKLCLKEVQEESLKILEEVDTFCRNNSIKYFIFFGTLIGAVRHKGFIPWDDDIDIAMTRENYDKFLKLYSKSGKYRIINYLSEPKCPYMITRISNDDFVLESEFGPDYKIGIFIDVYPLDGVGEKKNDIRKLGKHSLKYSKRLARSLEKNPINCVSRLHNGIKKWLLLPLYVVPKALGPDYYRKKLIKLKNVHSYDDSNYVGCAVWHLIDKESFRKEWIEDVENIEFENLKVLAPKYYDKVLSHNYHNYMELPPENMRVAHHYYKIYKK